MAPYMLSKEGLGTLVIVSALINERPLIFKFFTGALSATTLNNNPNQTFTPPLCVHQKYGLVTPVVITTKLFTCTLDTVKC